MNTHEHLHLSGVPTSPHWVKNPQCFSDILRNFGNFFHIKYNGPLLSISDASFVVIAEVGIVVVPMNCNIVWAESILMPSEVRLKNFLECFCMK